MCEERKERERSAPLQEARKESGRLQKILCVTNRHMVTEHAGIPEADSEEGRRVFLAQVERVTERKPRAIILREKDLDEKSYRSLARDVLDVCHNAGVPCILHTYPTVALDLGADGLHLPLPLLAKLDEDMRKRFRVLGASCHSVRDVMEAQSLGCTYVTVGHIYATDCKPGVPPRGLALLRDCVQAATIPVYAIGGITRARLPDVLQAGAAGACVMSGFMRKDM